MNRKYSIGLDFGTLSARAILIDVENGNEAAISTFKYKDGVINQNLPETDIKLNSGSALQNPKNYIEALEYLLYDVWRKADILPQQVIGIGVGFTSCTMMPVDKNFMPLCFKPEYKNHIHAWTKLWKHHGAQKEADHINSIATLRSERFITRYGNKSSSEWMFAKILEILNNDPDIYRATFRFIEGGDWVVYLLTGEEKKSSCLAGYKSILEQQGWLSLKGVL